MPADLDACLRSGKPVGVLFDANVLLDVFLLRENAVPAARTLTLTESDVVKGYICASVFGVICYHGAARGSGRGQRERQLAAEMMQFLEVIPLTKEVLEAALNYESLSFEDAQVAAAGDLMGIDVIVTSDDGLIRNHHLARRPQDLVSVLESHLGEQIVCRVIKVTPEGAFRVEIADPAGGWKQALPLAGFPTQEEAERVAGLQGQE